MILLVLPSGAPLDSHSEYQGKKTQKQKQKKLLGFLAGTGEKKAF